MAATEFVDAVERVIARIPAGHLVTYGEVAEEAGFPGAARAVGNVLAGCGDRLPWWRVITASGRLVPGHEAEHARRLRAEGIDAAGLGSTREAGPRWRTSAARRRV